LTTPVAIEPMHPGAVANLQSTIERRHTLEEREEREGREGREERTAPPAFDLQTSIRVFDACFALKLSIASAGVSVSVRLAPEPRAAETRTETADLNG
jgi:hypothetical protein